MTTDNFSVPAPAPAPKKSPWLKWVGIGCGLLILLGICFAAVMFFVVKKATAGPELVVHEFLAAAGAGDYAKAHSYFSAPLKEAQPLEKFQEAVEAKPGMFKVKETTFNNRSMDLSGARLSGTLTLESGTQIPARFDLAKENDQWRLLGYQIGESE